MPPPLTQTLPLGCPPLVQPGDAGLPPLPQAASHCRPLPLERSYTSGLEYFSGKRIVQSFPGRACSVRDFHPVDAAHVDNYIPWDGLSIIPLTHIKTPGLKKGSRLLTGKNPVDGEDSPGVFYFKSGGGQAL